MILVELIARFQASDDLPYCLINCTTLFANVCLLPMSAAISLNSGCVAVPLSEKDLELLESILDCASRTCETYQPPMLTKTTRSGLTDLRFAVSWNSPDGVDVSMVTTL